ncbi:MAG TPA: cation:proton antiporter [Burkholderiaceae bacterium]|nr:cation:proton antiporter [Burkholderiaceae bacterium]
MTFAIWALIAGVIFTVMALSGTLLKRLPLSTSMLYLLAGFVLGPAGFALLNFSPITDHRVLEIIAEAALLVSLFAVGLKLTLPLSDTRWRAALRLAMVSMLITVALLSAVGVVLFNLPLGAAVLLAAMLAPTDPVLASDVQLENPNDRDSVRFALTAEGGLNDGAAFPFVMLGLALLGLRDTEPSIWRWLTLDLVWPVVGGLAIGAVCGYAIGKLVVYLRTRHQEAVGLDEFLMLGLIGVAYGASQLAATYGFLAVFAAGLALQRSQRKPADTKSEATDKKIEKALAGGGKEEVATDPQLAGAYMTQAVRGFNEQLERIVEVAIVVIVGAMLTLIVLPQYAIVYLILLFFIVRPFSVWLGLAGLRMPGDQKLLIAWFGIRGIGSIYYLLYAIGQGLVQAPLTQLMLSIVLTAVAVSIVVHGISVTPLMKLYSARRNSGKGRPTRE